MVIAHISKEVYRYSKETYMKQWLERFKELGEDIEHIKS